MALTTINDNSIHEAGHSIIAYLCLDLIKIEFVTVNYQLSKMNDSLSEGGIKLKIIKPKKDLCFRDHDRLILIFLAGLTADEINNNNGFVPTEAYKNEVFANNLNSNKYSGDSELIVNHLSFISKYLSIDQRAYTLSCHKLLHNIFANEIIQPILIALSHKIETANLKFLTGQEIIEILDRTNLKKWRDNNWRHEYFKREKTILKRSFIFIKIKKTINSIFTRF